MYLYSVNEILFNLVSYTTLFGIEAEIDETMGHFQIVCLCESRSAAGTTQEYLLALWAFWEQKHREKRFGKILEGHIMI